MEIREVALSASGGEPPVSVVIGQARFGSHREHLKDPRSNARVKAEGDNANNAMARLSEVGMEAEGGRRANVRERALRQPEEAVHTSYDLGLFLCRPGSSGQGCVGRPVAFMGLIVLLAVLGSFVDARAAQIYGKLNQPAGTPVRVQCDSGASAETTTDAQGSYRVYIDKTGRCTLSLPRQGDVHATVYSYDDPTRFDFDLVEGQLRGH